MSNAQYLYRRPSGVYFVRLCVPARLKVAVGKGEVHRSTGCRDFRLAKIVAAELAAHWHRAIEAVKGMDAAKVRAGSIELLGGGFIPLGEAAAALGAAPQELARRLAARGASFFVNASNWLGWPVASIHDDLEVERDELGQVTMVISPAKLGGPSAQRRFSGRLRVRHQEEAVAAAGPEGAFVCQFLVWPSRDLGFVTDLPGQNIRCADLEVDREAVETFRESLAAQLPSGAPTGASPEQALAQDPGILFSELATEYLKWNKPFWKADQLERRSDQCAAFETLMGDLPLKDINRQVLRRFGDEIAKLPTQRQQVRRKFGKPTATFKELIDLAEAHSLPRLTPEAQRRFLDGISEVFRWGEKETYVTANPATGLGTEVSKRTGAGRVKQQDQREAFSDADLTAIFSVEWFAAGVGRRTPKGTFFVYRPHYYWLPLLAMFSGGRLNELAQLYLSDIVEIDGIPCIDFNLEGPDKLDLDEQDGGSTAGDKSLKTVNSQRIIPLHATLVALGFLDYVKALRTAGHSRLFPELIFDKRKGYGKAAGSWFNERFLGNRLGIPRNGRKTFHSFRHNFATALGNLSVATTLKSDLMGHSRGPALVDARYDKGAQMVRFKEVIDKVTYVLPRVCPFDVQSGMAAVADATGLKKRHARRRSV